MSSDLLRFHSMNRELTLWAINANLVSRYFTDMIWCSDIWNANLCFTEFFVTEWKILDLLCHRLWDKKKTFIWFRWFSVSLLLSFDIEIKFFKVIFICKWIYMNFFTKKEKNYQQQLWNMNILFRIFLLLSFSTLFHPPPKKLTSIIIIAKTTKTKKI